jgi:serine/threonine protein kinase
LLHKEPDISKAGELKELLSGILQKSIEKRRTIKDLINDPWLTEGGLYPVELDLSCSIDDSSLRETDSICSESSPVPMNFDIK